MSFVFAHFLSTGAVDEDDMPSSCPLNQITQRIAGGLYSSDAGGMLICRALYGLADDCRAQAVLGGRALSRKGLLHLWEMVQVGNRNRAVLIRGSLHQQVHYTLCVRSGALVLHSLVHDVATRHKIDQLAGQYQSSSDL